MIKFIGNFKLLNIKDYKEKRVLRMAQYKTIGYKILLIL